MEPYPAQPADLSITVNELTDHIPPLIKDLSNADKTKVKKAIARLREVLQETREIFIDADRHLEWPQFFKRGKLHRALSALSNLAEWAIPPALIPFLKSGPSAETAGVVGIVGGWSNYVKVWLDAVDDALAALVAEIDRLNGLATKKKPPKRRLTDKQTKILDLRLNKHLSNKEIATREGVSERAIRMRAERVRKKGWDYEPDRHAKKPKTRRLHGGD
jgi:hypothetical protein